MHFSIWKGSLKGEIFKSSPISPTAFCFFTRPTQSTWLSAENLAFNLKGEANFCVSSSGIAGGGHGFGNPGPELWHQQYLLPWVQCATLSSWTCAREELSTDASCILNTKFICHFCSKSGVRQKIAHRMACGGNQHCKWVSWEKGLVFPSDCKVRIRVLGCLDLFLLSAFGLSCVIRQTASAVPAIPSAKRNKVNVGHSLYHPWEYTCSNKKNEIVVKKHGIWQDNNTGIP